MMAPTTTTTRAAADGPWGTTAFGLQCRVTALDGLAVRLEIRNASDRPVTITNAGLWPNHRLIVTSHPEEGVPAMTPRGAEVTAAFSPHGARRKTIPIALEPGQVHVTANRIDLADLYKLPPGRYSVSFEYHEGDVHVVSNKIVIDVRAAP